MSTAAPAWKGRHEEESVSAVDFAALSPLACLAVVPLRNTHALLGGILTVGSLPVIGENYAIDIPGCRLEFALAHHGALACHVQLGVGFTEVTADWGGG
jgi:hypothetical protein